MCGKNLSKDTVSTIGAQRQFNYALKPMSQSEFVKLVSADQPEAPAYFFYDADYNKKVRTTLNANLEKTLKPLSLESVLAASRDQNAVVLDVREPAEFAPSHLKGSVNIGLSGRFASWVGTVIDPKKPLVIVAPLGREKEAAMRLGRIGFDLILGYLTGGAGGWASRSDVVETTEDTRRSRTSPEVWLPGNPRRCPR
jgi:rhodanese-related sulfurtransferase